LHDLGAHAVSVLVVVLKSGHHTSCSPAYIRTDLLRTLLRA
jgi:hypothetical protein